MLSRADQGLFEMYAQIVMQGYIPDTMLVHPMTWLMWVKDPVLREFAIRAGGGSFFAQFTGKPAAKAYEGQYNYGGLGQGLGQFQPKTEEGPPQIQNSAPQIPFYGNGLMFRSMVSPIMRFDPGSRLSAPVPSPSGFAAGRSIEMQCNAVKVRLPTRSGGC